MKTTIRRLSLSASRTARSVILAWITTMLVSPAAVALTTEESTHLLLRAGFGPDQSLLQKLEPLNRQQAVQALLQMHDSTFIVPDCARLEPPSGKLKKVLSDTDYRTYQKQYQGCVRETQSAYLTALLHTQAPLTDHMTLFWQNHFTSAIKKVRYIDLQYQQYTMLRHNSLGNFQELLSSVVNDPAMLIYLDNTNNHRGRPNENLARELLELFTLGEGHYTENDIKEIARALTGLTVDVPTKTAHIVPALHDPRAKTIFGNQGRFGPKDVVEIILQQPAAARFITRKIWLEFVSKTNEKMIEQLASEFSKDWNINNLVEKILLSDTFWSDQGQMIKSPIELMIGTERLLPAMQRPRNSLLPLAKQLEQDPFNPPNVKGWPTGFGWLDASRLMARANFAERLLRGLEQEAEADDLKFLCSGAGPGRFAALPQQWQPEPDENCAAQLISLMTSPVWQLK